MKKKKKGSFATFLLILILLLGLSLLLYPSFSEFWNSRHQTQTIASYESMVANLKEEDFTRFLEEAAIYNRNLLRRDNGYALTESLETDYYDLLNVGGSGIMGYIDIPSIHVHLPIYHGTSDAVLEVAVGHLDWSSLPVGGEGTHCLLSGHRGLPSARLFTDLDQLAVGDYFTIHVLDRVLTYEVSKILIVEPHETQNLIIEEKKDLVTLITCTPYGVNSHRLLVQGHRVDNLEEAQEVRVTADAMVVEQLVVAPFVLAPILLGMLLWMLIGSARKKKRRKSS